MHELGFVLTGPHQRMDATDARVSSQKICDRTCGVARTSRLAYTMFHAVVIHVDVEYSSHDECASMEAINIVTFRCGFCHMRVESRTPLTRMRTCHLTSMSRNSNCPRAHSIPHRTHTHGCHAEPMFIRFLFIKFPSISSVAPLCRLIDFSASVHSLNLCRSSKNSSNADI